MGRLHYTVASWAERDDLVIELTTGEGEATEDWGLVTYDPHRGKAVIDIYPRPNNGEWNFDLDEVNAILALARQEILEAAGPEARKAMIAAQADRQPASAG